MKFWRGTPCKISANPWQSDEIARGNPCKIDANPWKIDEIDPKRIQSVSKIVRIQNVSITYPKRIQNTRIHNVSKFGPPYPKRIHNVSKTYPKRIQRMSVSKKVRIQKKSVSPSAAESMFFRLILDTNLLMPLCGGMSIILDTTPCILGPFPV